MWGIAVWLPGDVRQRRRGAEAAGRPAGESLASPASFAGDLVSMGIEDGTLLGIENGTLHPGPREVCLSCACSASTALEAVG